jgi:hypothetical protein
MRIALPNFSKIRFIYTQNVILSLANLNKSRSSSYYPRELKNIMIEDITPSLLSVFREKKICPCAGLICIEEKKKKNRRRKRKRKFI